MYKNQLFISHRLFITINRMSQVKKKPREKIEHRKNDGI